MNKFIGYERGFPDRPKRESSAPEFAFSSYSDFVDNYNIKNLIAKNPGMSKFKMLRQHRNWIGSDGKVSKSFYTVILESNKGCSWFTIGRCEHDVPEIPAWDK